jgi:hypothetical protein
MPEEEEEGWISWAWGKLKKALCYIWCVIERIIVTVVIVVGLIQIGLFVAGILVPAGVVAGASTAAGLTAGAVAGATIAGIVYSMMDFIEITLKWIVDVEKCWEKC